MHIIEVIPLINIPRNQTQVLSYFFTQTLPPGAIVEIPLRKKNIKAVVVNSKPISIVKIKIKKESDFQLKSVSKVLSEKPLVGANQIELAMWLSSYFYYPLGTAIRTILPPFWNVKKYQNQINAERENNNLTFREQQKTPKTTYIQTKNLKNHFKDYLPVLEKHHGKKKILLLIPDSSYGEYFLEKYEKYEPVFVNSELNNQKYHQIWEKINSGAPVLIVGTRISLFLPFKNLGAVILDDEPNEAYKPEARLKYDTRVVAQKIASARSAEFIINALNPTVETYSKSPSSWFNYKPRTKATPVNMVDEIKNGNFSIISRELRDQLLTHIAKKENIILFSSRKGYAPTLICRNCGQAINCENCSASMAVYKARPETSDGKNKILKCRHCEKTKDAPDLCPSCGSYKLKPYGAGADKIKEQLEIFLKKTGISPSPIFLLDADKIKNRADEKSIMEKFYNAKGAILIATRMLLSHQYKTLSQSKNLSKIPFICIINADSLSVSPDFRTEEEAFRIMSTLKNMTDDLAIQAHNIQNPAILAVLNDGGKEFYDSDLRFRKELNYPPFSEMVKLLHNNKNPRRAAYDSKVVTEKLKQMSKLVFSEYTAEILGPAPAFIAKEKGEYFWETIIKIKKNGKGVNHSISARNELLKIVPPKNWKIEII